MIENSNKREKVEFPEGKIVLLDGTELECIHMAETIAEDAVSDELALDTTGQYLSVGKKKPAQQPSADEQKMQQEELFLNNAFYLLAHKDRIMNDSRMFLAPVAVQSGLAYTGTSGFNRPTLGVYLEWWQTSDEAMRIDNEGCRSLVYRLSGSPLSGMNRCSAVREDGNIETVTLSSFNNHCGSFIKINRRYTNAKAKYQAHSLQQVLDILHGEDDGIDLAHAIDTQFFKYEINKLNAQVRCLTKDRDEWHQRYCDLLLTSNDARIREFYAEYKALKSRVDLETIYLKKQKQSLKAELKSGRMDNVTYQKQVGPINKRLQELEFNLGQFTGDKLRELFPHDHISLSMIEEYIYKHRK